MLDLEVQVTNLSHQVEDIVRNAVASARLRVDRIHKPTKGAPQPDPRGACNPVSTGGGGVHGGGGNTSVS